MENPLPLDYTLRNLAAERREILAQGDVSGGREQCPGKIASPQTLSTSPHASRYARCMRTLQGFF